MTNRAGAGPASDWRTLLKALLRAFLNRLGKGGEKVAVVFGFSPAASRQAVLRIRQDAPDVPIWLFSSLEPPLETAALCEHVFVCRRPLALLFQAEAQLWHRWVAITAGCWTGERGHRLMKLAPFLIPMCRTVFINGNGDFLPGTVSNVMLHCRRRLVDRVHSGSNRVLDLSRAYWRLITYHIWCSGPCTRVKDVLAATSLLVAATALKWCSYPDRRLFRRLHGDEPLSTVPASARGSGTVPYRHTGASWDGAALEKFAVSSDARWIVWFREDAGDPVYEMLPLLEDERTFAVSRQSHFRDWRPMLLPTSPFRILELGEASQVLAPLSDSIVVDRCKLLALGIPRCSMAWTAWLVLFWKAAAAGWRSYSMGRGGNVRQDPDHPLPERAFIFRVLTDPALRRLGPRNPNLSRGTIAFRPGMALAGGRRTNRPKVLLVSPFLPYPLSHGGAVRMFNLCRAMSDRVDFMLVAIREKREIVAYQELHEIFREVRIVDLDEVPSADDRLPLQVRQHKSPSLRAAIAELCTKWKPDLLQIEYTHMAQFRDSAPEVPAILVEHDLTFSLYRQLAQSQPSKAAWREYQRWLGFERRWLQAYDAIWTVSESDRRLAILEGSRPDRTFVIPNGVDTIRFAPSEAAASAPEILYVGSFRHVPNILGFEKLRGEIMPRVWKTFPNLTVRVVAGPEHNRFWSRFAKGNWPLDSDRRIEIHGFVEDLRPLYTGAAVVAVPLAVSAGTNIKVLEAMACGKATVTTPAGCCGLGLQDGYDALIREDWGTFAAAVCDVLSDPALRSRIAAQARRTAEDRFSWRTIQEMAYQSYLQVIAWHSSQDARLHPRS